MLFLDCASKGGTTEQQEKVKKYIYTKTVALRKKTLGRELH